eukprot:5633914-Pyramimonas_sp.AAC.1
MLHWRRDRRAHRTASDLALAWCAKRRRGLRRRSEVCAARPCAASSPRGSLLKSAVHWARQPLRQYLLQTGLGQMASVQAA